jgi:peptidoglycan/LPS O-acetylase OafA/YrhL
VREGHLVKPIRMYALDGARGLAAFSVLLFHLFGSYGMIFSNLYIAVDFFFALSGFVLAHSLSKIENISQALKFIVRRFFRIFPMVLAVLVFTVCYDLAIILKHLYFNEPSTPTIVLNLPTLLFSFALLQIFYLPALLVNFPVWSLSAEWIVNFVSAFSMLFIKRFFLKGAVLGFLMIITSWYLEDELLNQLGRAAWGFTLGVVSFNLRNRILNFQIRTLAILICLAFIPIYYSIQSLGSFQALLTIWPFLGTIVILASVEVGPVKNRFFAWLGKYSYGFYIWQIPMISILSIVLKKFTWFIESSTLGQTLIILILGIVSILFVTKLSLKFIEGPIRKSVSIRLGNSSN